MPHLVKSDSRRQVFSIIIIIKMCKSKKAGAVK